MLLENNRRISAFHKSHNYNAGYSKPLQQHESLAQWFPNREPLGGSGSLGSRHLLPGKTRTITIHNFIFFVILFQFTDVDIIQSQKNSFYLLLQIW